MKVCKMLFTILLLINIQGIISYNFQSLCSYHLESVYISISYKSISNSLISVVGSTIPFTIGSLIHIMIPSVKATTISSVTSTSTTSTSTPSTTSTSTTSTSTPSTTSTSTTSTSTPSTTSTSTTSISTTSTSTPSTTSISTSSVVSTTSVSSSSSSNTVSSTSASASSSSSAIECPPDPLCNTSQVECLCNAIITDTDCTTPKYQFIDYILNTSNLFKSEYSNFSDTDTTDFLLIVNSYIVEILQGDLGPICSHIHEILNGSVILNITVYIDISIYNPSLTESYIAKKLLVNDPSFPLNISSITISNVPGSCVQNFTYPNTQSNISGCDCLLRPNTEILLGGCTVFYRFFQIWNVNLLNLTTNQSYTIEPKSGEDETYLIEALENIVSSLYITFPSLNYGNMSLIGPNMVYVEYKFSELSELIINTWEALINNVNLTTQADFSFGTNILISIVNTSSLTDVNECQMNNVCHTNATCLNLFGIYTCECNPNFVGNGTYCTSYNGANNYCKNSQNPVWVLDQLFCLKPNSVNYYRYRRTMIVMSVIGGFSIMLLAVLVAIVGIF